MMPFTRCFILDDEATEVDVAYTLTGGSPAITSGPPEFCDPGEDPEVEITGACKIKPAGEPVDLTTAEQERFISEVLADLPEDDGPDPDDLRDQAYDDSRNGGDRWPT